MKLDVRSVSIFPIVVLLVTWSFVLVHGIIENLAYKNNALGGKFFIYDAMDAIGGNISEDINHLQINLQYWYEVGSNTSVILRGTDSFANEFFDLVDLHPSNIGDISASEASASTGLVPSGDLAMNLYLVTGTGTLFNADESFEVDFFDVKFNILLSNYQFCDDCPARNNRNMEFLDPLREAGGAVDVATDNGGSGRGEYIDVAFSVIGRTIRETGNIGRVSSDRLEFGLGGTISLVLSTKVKIDGTWMDMPDGFPALDRLEDGVPVFVARFPRFTDTAFYDPLLTTSKQGFPTSAPSSQPSSTPVPSLFPTVEPTSKPTAVPTSEPTAVPTSPTLIPSSSPTNEPTSAPSTLIPSSSPTNEPTSAPSTLIPSSSPTKEPTSAPVMTPSGVPVTTPVTSPSGVPVTTPVTSPSGVPVMTPITSPSGVPVTTPATSPSGAPVTTPATSPSGLPVTMPVTTPSGVPVTTPVTNPSGVAVTTPVTSPSGVAVTTPVTSPSGVAVTTPGTSPSGVPVTTPVTTPSGVPVTRPVTTPSGVPVTTPVTNPSGVAVTTPISTPSRVPVTTPATTPSGVPVTTPISSPSGVAVTTPGTSPSGVAVTTPSEGPVTTPVTSPSGGPVTTPVTSPSGVPVTTPVTTPSGIAMTTQVTTPSGVPVTTPGTSPSGVPVTTPVTTPSGVSSTMPVMTPSGVPVTTPVTSPSGVPVTTPVTSPSGVPVTTPVTSPSGFPVTTQVTSPSGGPVTTPVTSPSEGPVTTPVTSPSGVPATTPVTSPSGVPVMTPVTSPSDVPVTMPLTSPSRVPVTTPVTSPSGVPVTTPVTTPSGVPFTIPNGEMPSGDETPGTGTDLDRETPPEGPPGTDPGEETVPREGPSGTLPDGATLNAEALFGPGYVTPTCGDLSSDSSIVLTAWNTFEDATETEGAETIVDRHATLMTDGIEFPLFPERSPDGNSPLILYDIDFTHSSITFTLRNIPDATHQVFSDGSFDRYYFDLGASVSNASIDTDLTTINSMVEVLPQGYTTPLVDPLNLRIVMPVLINGGILVSVLPGASLTELGQSIVVCYSREEPWDRTAVAFEDEDVVEADDKVCGDQGSDSSILIAVWNTFEDAIDTEGKEVIWDTVDATPMTDGIEFIQFPSNPPDNNSPWGVYDIDFTSSSITYTLRNNSAASHLVFPEGTFDRYYFKFKGKTVTEATIVRDETTITSNIQILLPGFTEDSFDQMETGATMPALVNGGILVSIVPGADITELGQKIVICYSLEDGEEESTFDLGLESDRSSSSRFHSYSSIFSMVVVGIAVGIVGCL